MSVELIKKTIPNFINLHYSDIEQYNHPSILKKGSDYYLLILNKGVLHSSHFDFSSEAFIFFNNDVFIFDREQGDLKKLKDSMASFFSYLNYIYETNKNILLEYASEVNRIEDQLFSRNLSRHFINQWFDFKKDLSKKERLLERNVDVLTDFSIEFKELGKKEKSNLTSLIHEMDNSHTSCEGLLSKLDSIFNYYTSIKNDRLNNNIYVMTVLSAIFLPLNLIVGFFGMNTENLIFKDNPHGTFYVLMGLCGIFVLSLLGLKLVKLIDYLLLRRLLGKYNFYERISSKISSIELF